MLGSRVPPMLVILTCTSSLSTWGSIIGLAGHNLAIDALSAGGHTKNFRCHPEWPGIAHRWRSMQASQPLTSYQGSSFHKKDIHFFLYSNFASLSTLLPPANEVWGKVNMFTFVHCVCPQGGCASSPRLISSSRGVPGSGGGSEIPGGYLVWGV